MKKIILLLVCATLSMGIKAQSPLGAWESNSISESGDTLKSIVIFADGYQVLTIYNATKGKFIHANGGTWKLNGDVMTEKREFHTDNAALVGTEVSFKIAITPDSLTIVGSKKKFKRIDDGKPGALQGAWLMSGRIIDGKAQQRDTSVARKTMKILSGTRFQWIAYDTDTKQFLGTGGGTYTTQNGEYAERIAFFSKDETRVGLRLKFHYELKEGHWEHSGLSSKGDPIHEIWSIRK
jgi:hypothetical protein